MANNDFNNVVYKYTAETNVLEEENKILKQTISQLRSELNSIKEGSLLVCEIGEVFENKAIIKVPNGNKFYVNYPKGEAISPGDTVLVEQKNLNVVKKLPVSKNFDTERFVIIEKPTVSWKNVGGLDKQIEEIKEVIELPLKKPGLFKELGIKPPKGILLYGPPGTGKTLLAKAVANSTNSTFIEIIGSELVQKFIGEGAKLVKELFELAKNKAPSIVFIDELDAIAAKRIDLGTSGEREVQRTFMQLLAELDGFKNLDNVKIIAATNRKDILDPAMIRPGRLDRQIEIPVPMEKERLDILRVHTRDMKIDKIDFIEVNRSMEGFSGAEIQATCTEAGYYAIREDRNIISKKDFIRAIEKVKKIENKEFLHMFG